MNSEYWFGELAQSLKNGFFSDSVVLELARVQRDKSVSENQKTLFGNAAKVLLCAVEGSRWLDDPKMSENANICASFFGQAVEAIPIVLTPDAFARQLQNLAKTADRLSMGQTPPGEEIKALRTFFFNTGRMELEKTENLMDGENETDRLKWIAAK